MSVMAAPAASRACRGRSPDGRRCRPCPVPKRLRSSAVPTTTWCSTRRVLDRVRACLLVIDRVNAQVERLRRVLEQLLRRRPVRELRPPRERAALRPCFLLPQSWSFRRESEVVEPPVDGLARASKPRGELSPRRCPRPLLPFLRDRLNRDRERPVGEALVVAPPKARRALVPDLASQDSDDCLMSSAAAEEHYREPRTRRPRTRRGRSTGRAGLRRPAPLTHSREHSRVRLLS